MTAAPSGRAGARGALASLRVRWARPPEPRTPQPFAREGGGTRWSLSSLMFPLGWTRLNWHPDWRDWWSRDHSLPKHAQIHTHQGQLGWVSESQIGYIHQSWRPLPVTLRAAVGLERSSCLRATVSTDPVPAAGGDRGNRTVGRLVKNNAVSQPRGPISKEKPAPQPGAELRSSLPGLGAWLSSGAAQIPAPGGASYLWSEQAPGDEISVPATLPGCGWRQPLKVNLRINGYFKYRLIRAMR